MRKVIKFILISFLFIICIWGLNNKVYALTETSSLKIDGIEVIKDGEVLVEKYEKGNFKFIYDKESNTLSVYEQTYQVLKHDNMGEDFKVISYRLLSGKWYNTDNLVGLDIIDENGNYVTYLPPESGGLIGFIDSSLNYDKCKYSLYIPQGDYEETIIIEELGTFKKQGNNYIADIKDKSILKDGKYKGINFKAKNSTTGEYDELCAFLLCFKNNFKSTTNLSVNGKYMIKNGEIIEDELIANTGYVGYDKARNNLTVWGYEIENINYNDMGIDFAVTNIKSTPDYIIVEKYHPYTGVRLQGKGKDAVSEQDMIVVNDITSGNIYNQVISTLGDEHKNLQIYDISIENNFNTKIQPNGNVEISIPIKMKWIFQN